MHYMIIYPDLSTLREFYSHYTHKQIQENSNNDEVILINPFYETSDSVRQVLSEGHTAIDVNKHEKEEKTLLIIDSFTRYFDTQDSDWSLKERMVNHVKKLGKRGFSILGDTGAYPFKGQYKELVDYELSLPAEYDIAIKDFCLYHQKDLDRFSEEQKQKLIDHHSMTIKIIL